MKKINILLLIGSVISISLAIFFLVNFFKYVPALSNKSYVAIGSNSDYKIYYYKDTAIPLVLFNLIAFVLCFIVSALNLYASFQINKNKIIVTIDEAKEHNTKKRQQKKEQKKAKLQRQLDELNKKDGE